MKLRRLKIEKFRNVQPGTELEFNDGYNILLGQNGTGKTTLLRLISSVLRGDFRWLENVEFALEAELEGDGERLFFSIRHERQPNAEKSLPAIPAELHTYIPTRDTWSTTITSSIVAGATDAWKVRQSDKTTTTEGTGLAQPESFDTNWTQLSAIHSLHTIFIHRALLRQGEEIYSLNDWCDSIFQLNDVYRFDESLEVFSSITGRASELGKPEYYEVLGRPRTRLMSFMSRSTTNGWLVPLDIQEHESLKNPSFTSPANTIILKHDQTEFLAKVTPMLGYVGSELKLDLLGKEVTEEQQKIEYGNLRFFFHGRDGSIVNQDHLSYGQKRLLTFYYYLACNPHVVVADELVNGLHHAWIEKCIEEMGDRQVFITSQNPVLLDHLNFTSADQVRRTFITCQSKPEGNRDRITWANMTKKNADAFYRAYKVGAQHVGEILRTKGFW